MLAQARQAAGRRAHALSAAALELLIDYGVERAREICEAEEELEAPKTAVDGLARFAGEQGLPAFFSNPRSRVSPSPRPRMSSKSAATRRSKCWVRLAVACRPAPVQC